MTTIPGYRLATTADLREGVEVLIPGRLDQRGDIQIPYAGGCRWHVIRDVLPGLAFVRDDIMDRGAEADMAGRADRAEAALAAVAAVICPLTGQFASDDVLSAAHWVRGRLGAAERAEAERDAMRKAGDPDVHGIRAQLADATDAALQSAGRHGRLDAMITAAAILCEIAADGAEERLSALVDLARGGGR